MLFWSILQYFDLHLAIIGLENQFFVFVLSHGHLRQVLLYCRKLFWSILQYFWPAFSDNRSWKPIFCLCFEWPLKTGFTVLQNALSSWSILQYFWPALSDIPSWKPILVFFLSGPLRQVFLYKYKISTKSPKCLRGADWPLLIPLENSNSS